jgi:glycosyltransferase involved in cell wall biosynthesis
VKRLLFLITEDWYFCVHWLPLAVAARDAGYDVNVACRVEAHGQKIDGTGIGLHPLRRFSRRTGNPLRELGAIHEISELYRRLRPDLVHHIALKSVVYGSIAARRTGMSAVVNLIAGLGYVFSSPDLKARVVRPVMEASLRILLDRDCARLVTQNLDDLNFFVNEGLVHPSRATVVSGAGVDLHKFSASAEPEGTPLVVLPARMLRDKGVEEFVEASRRLRGSGIQARFALVGAPDGDNPAGIPEQQLRAWRDEGVVEWWGWRDDMAAVYRQCAIVCLPSWREGLPTSLAEAAASARPIVTCDVPGCREVVSHGDNGLLVPPRDATALASALALLLADKDLRRTYGAASRLRAVEFSVPVVTSKMLAVYHSLESGRPV